MAKDDAIKAKSGKKKKESGKDNDKSDKSKKKKISMCEKITNLLLCRKPPKERPPSKIRTLTKKKETNKPAFIRKIVDDDSDEEEESKWSEEDLAAIKIQCMMRRFEARYTRRYLWQKNIRDANLFWNKYYRLRALEKAKGRAFKKGTINFSKEYVGNMLNTPRTTPRPEQPQYLHTRM